MGNGTEHDPHLNPDHRLSVTLLPCGPVDQTELNDLTKALSMKGMDVRIAEQRPIPEQTFHSGRGQYRADGFLAVARNEPAERVLVVTNCDLYADGLNFVFGLAESYGKCAVISLFRLRMKVREGEFRRRAVKEAVHEIGHTLGLSHCAHPRCVMHFSNCLEDTDRKGIDLCEQCKKRASFLGSISLLT
jgi:archaemetzincin